MKHTMNIVVMAITIIGVVWVGMNFSNESPFHPPKTDAEKALDTTLRKISDDEYALENTHIRPGPVPKANRVDYSPMLSAKLTQKLATDEKQMVSDECNDVYIDGESCGFDYDPILCTQDTNTVYGYQTTHEDADTAAIDYSWPVSAGRKEATIAHYGLVKTADGWKIDSVTCVFD